MTRITQVYYGSSPVSKMYIGNVPIDLGSIINEILDGNVGFGAQPVTFAVNPNIPDGSYPATINAQTVTLVASSGSYTIDLGLAFAAKPRFPGLPYSGRIAAEGISVIFNAIGGLSMVLTADENSVAMGELSSGDQFSFESPGDPTVYTFGANSDAIASEGHAGRKILRDNNAGFTVAEGRLSNNISTTGRIWVTGNPNTGKWVTFIHDGVTEIGTLELNYAGSADRLIFAQRDDGYFVFSSVDANGTVINQTVSQAAMVQSVITKMTFLGTQDDGAGFSRTLSTPLPLDSLAIALTAQVFADGAVEVHLGDGEGISVATSLTLDQAAIDNLVASTPYPIASAFIATYRTSGAAEVATIKMYGAGMSFDWGDGIITHGHNGAASHTYAAPGDYDIRVTGDLSQLYVNSDAATMNKYIGIEFGSTRWASLYRFARGASNLVSATGIPDLTNVEDARGAFDACTSLAINVVDWITDAITYSTNILRNVPNPITMEVIPGALAAAIPDAAEGGEITFNIAGIVRGPSIFVPPTYVIGGGATVDGYLDVTWTPSAGGDVDLTFDATDALGYGVLQQTVTVDVTPLDKTITLTPNMTAGPAVSVASSVPAISAINVAPDVSPAITFNRNIIVG